MTQPKLWVFVKKKKKNINMHLKRLASIKLLGGGIATPKWRVHMCGRQTGWRERMGEYVSEIRATFTYANIQQVKHREDGVAVNWCREKVTH